MYRVLRVLLIAAIIMLGYIAVMTGINIPYAWVAIVIVLVALLRRRNRALHAYGTAAWSSPAQIQHLLKGKGLSVGEIEGRISRLDGLKSLFDFKLPADRAVRQFITACQRRQQKQIVRLSNAVHTAVFAPTGSGKGVSCVIPFLLTNPESVVVLDFKGENARICSEARRKMGSRVVVIDPYRVVTTSPDTLNPLDFIDMDSDTALIECRDLAVAIVVRTGQEKEPHWCDSAEVWITAMIAVTVCFAEPEHRNMQSVRTLLTDPERMQGAIKLMCESTDIWSGMLSRLGHQLTHFKDKELASTLTTTNRFLRFLDTIPIAESTKRSSFNLAGLLTGKMTVFLVLPPEHMRAESGLLRLWIGTMLRAVVKGGLSDRKVHFVLDEAASLGHLESLDDAVDKYRGYGVRLQLYYQSLGQLKTCWPEGQDQTLLSNTTQVFFGVNDQQTAVYVSDRLGEFTQVVTSGGTSSGGSSQESSGQGQSTSYSRSWNSNSNWQQAGRKLLKPEEVANLHERIAITFTPGALPIWTTLLRYYEPGFGANRGIGPVKSAIDTACLFLTASTLAVMVTALFLQHR